MVDLEEWIKEGLSKGYSKEQLRQELAKAGKSINSQFWGTHHREAFAELYKVASGGRITIIGSRATLTQRFPESLAKIKEIVTGRVGG